MKELINKLKKSKLAQRILKLGLAYVALELIIAIGAIIFVAQEALA
jgi:hypothetical protein